MEPRIIIGEPAEVYHQRVLGVASKSALDQVARSPAHYRAWLEHGSESTKAMAFGSALHCAVLEPAVFKRDYVVMPSFGDLRTNKAKEAKAEWELSNGGKTAISADDMATIDAMQVSLMRHPAASRLLGECEREVSMRWTDAVTGLECKARADGWVKSKRIAIDLKTTDNASPDEFKRSVSKYRYHVQDASYRAGFNACGEQISHFAIIAVEKSAPYAVAVYTLDSEAVARGYAAYRRDLDVLAECVRANTWPSYSEGVEELSLPAWAA